MVAANLTKWVAWGRIVVHEIHGWNAQGADLYIQLHQTPPLTAAGGALTAGTIPAFKSLLAQQANGFMYNFGAQGVELSELLIAISTTEPNYTAVGAAGGIDLTIDFDTQFAVDGTEVIVGDLTTGVVATQQVWSEATGLAAPKRLLRVDFKNNDGATKLYNVVYAVDTPTPSNPPSLIFSSTPCPVSVTTNILYSDFQGRSLRPFQQDANYTQHNGCSISPSSDLTAGTLWGGTAPNIRSIYKPL